MQKKSFSLKSLPPLSLSTQAHMDSAPLQLQQAWLETQLFQSPITKSFWSFSPDVSPPPLPPPSPPPAEEFEASFMDPSLQFLNDMLMEEDMENRCCMAIECSAYQAMAKGFYEILGEDSSLSTSCANGQLQSTGSQDHLIDPCSPDDEWIDGVLNPEYQFTSEVADPSVSSFREFSSELSFDSSGSSGSQLEADFGTSSVWPIEMIGAMPEPDIHQVADVSQEIARDGNQMPGIWEFGSDKYSRTGFQSAIVDVESVSFVRNEDLNAECNATLHRDGPVKVKCCKTKHVSTTKPPLTLDMVDLRGLLLSCAKAISVDDRRKAHECLQIIREHASPYGSSTQRLAHYFAEALVARLSGTGPRLYTALTDRRSSAAQMLRAYRFYVEVSPFVTISHFFANQSILKAAEGSSRLHIVDYGILYGLQWPSLISALAERKGGPPKLRITGIDFPLPGLNPAERIEESGKRLAEYARTYGVPFEFQSIAGNWENINPAMLNLRQEETLVVTCINRLRHLPDETVMAASPRKIVLEKIRALNPKLFVVAVVNGGLNAPFFLSRFREALFHFSSKLDMLDTMTERENTERMRVESDMVGRDILNIVACEGLERVERLETYRQWHARLKRAGFVAVNVDQTQIVKKARDLVRGCYHKDFGVDDDGKWMFQEWKGRIMCAISSWVPNKF